MDKYSMYYYKGKYITCHQTGSINRIDSKACKKKHNACKLYKEGR